MKVEWRKLAEGIGNSLIIKEEIEKLAADRIAICDGCEHYSPNAIARGEDIKRKDKHCLDCRCNMYLKTRALSAMCPLGTAGSKYPQETSKWPAITIDGRLSEQVLETAELKPIIDNYKFKLGTNKLDEHGS